MDAENCEITGFKEITFPFEYLCCTPMCQIVEYDDGDILIPFAYNSPQNPEKGMVITVRYAFDGDGLKIVKIGTPLDGIEYGRGLDEPSVAYFDGKYYLTIRTDEVGLYAISDDGFSFSKPQPWKWEDGTVLENYNTQQHWMKSESGLYLTYTRRGAHNDHVFRHRAPIFMTQFDTENKCLVYDEEIILVPELGARLGNYQCIEAAENQSWLITAEWMQPAGCEKYGSDNSLWVAKVCWGNGVDLK